MVDYSKLKNFKVEHFKASEFERSLSWTFLTKLESFS